MAHLPSLSLKVLLVSAIGPYLQWNTFQDSQPVPLQPYYLLRVIRNQPYISYAHIHQHLGPYSVIPQIRAKSKGNVGFNRIEPTVLEMISPYLVGKTEFYSMEMEVSPDCLIPRPETELLVQRAIEFLRTREGKQYVCDLCTGCGCIAIAIAKNFPNSQIIATGGGAILDDQNVAAMKKSGTLIWLKASPETIEKRILRDRTTDAYRPSLTNQGTVKEINDTLKERTPFYTLAMDLSVDTDHRSISEVAEIITNKLMETGIL